MLDREKQIAIIDAAVAVFARYGFKKASIAEIARKAGVGKGTVYLACESKEDLFYQAVHRELRHWIGEASKMVDPRVPADKLLGQVSEMGRAYLDDHPLVRDLFLGLFHGQLPGWSSRFEELRAIGRANIAEIVRLGVRQGVFRDGLDVDEVAAVLGDMQIATYVYQVRHGKAASDVVQRRQRAAFDLVLRGLLAREGG